MLVRGSEWVAGEWVAPQPPIPGDRLGIAPGHRLGAVAWDAPLAGPGPGGRGEDRSSKVRHGPLPGSLLRVLGMLRRHALSWSTRDGVWRLPAERVGRAGGAPGAL